MRTHFVVCAFVAFLILLLSSEGAAQNVPFVYHRSGYTTDKSAAVEVEVGYGSREARPFGESGVEQGLRVRFSPLSWLNVEAWTGMLIPSGSAMADAYSTEVNVGLLSQETGYVNVTLGAGYLYDYQNVHVPRIRLAVSRTFGKLVLIATGLGELPLDSDRDAVDVVFGLAASYEVLQRIRVGLEVMGEDLEGFWENEEAEGGAKVIVGPTLNFVSSHNVHFKLNMGAVFAATNNEASRFVPGTNPMGDSGVIGKFVVGYSF